MNKDLTVEKENIDNSCRLFTFRAAFQDSQQLLELAKITNKELQNTCNILRKPVDDDKAPLESPLKQSNSLAQDIIHVLDDIKEELYAIGISIEAINQEIG